MFFLSDGIKSLTMLLLIVGVGKNSAVVLVLGAPALSSWITSCVVGIDVVVTTSIKMEKIDEFIELFNFDGM